MEDNELDDIDIDEDFIDEPIEGMESTPIPVATVVPSKPIPVPVETTNNTKVDITPTTQAQNPISNINSIPAPTITNNTIPTPTVPTPVSVVNTVTATPSAPITQNPAPTDAKPPSRIIKLNSTPPAKQANIEAAKPKVVPTTPVAVTPKVVPAEQQKVVPAKKTEVAPSKTEVPTPVPTTVPTTTTPAIPTVPTPVSTTTTEQPPKRIISLTSSIRKPASTTPTKTTEKKTPVRGNAKKVVPVSPAPVVVANDEAVEPPTQRPDGSWRKPLRVKPGYNPDDVVVEKEEQVVPMETDNVTSNTDIETETEKQDKDMLEDDIDIESGDEGTVNEKQEKKPEVVKTEPVTEIVTQKSEQQKPVEHVKPEVKKPEPKIEHPVHVEVPVPVIVTAKSQQQPKTVTQNKNTNNNKQVTNKADVEAVGAIFSDSAQSLLLSIEEHRKKEGTLLLQQIAKMYDINIEILEIEENKESMNQIKRRRSVSPQKIGGALKKNKSFATKFV